MCSARRQPVGVPTRDMGTGEVISTGPDALPNGFVPEFIRHNVRAKAEWSDWRRKGERLDAACIR